MSTIAHWKRQFKPALAESATAQALLSAVHINAHCRRIGHRWRKSYWSPSSTVVAFLLQALNGAKTLRATLADVLAAQVARDPDRPLPSSDPSAFAQARQRLPEALLAAVLADVTQQVGGRASAGRLWNGRRVVLVDGTCVSMPDTPELQESFPQPGSQKPGCGFPIARIVALFCWSCGAVLGFRIGSFRDGEIALFRSLLDMFMPGDVMLADRHYSSYTDIVQMTSRQVDVVVRMNQARPVDFRKGRCLGPEDRIVVWPKPKSWVKSCGLSREEFDALPAEMTLRMIRTTQVPKGFRSREIVIVTTILDPAKASREELLALYRDRWMVELNLRSVKTTLGMETLRGKSVDVVRKEVIMHFLLYNLIRLFMQEAASASGRDLRRLSFAGTLHRLRCIGAKLLLGRQRRGEGNGQLALLMAWIAKDLLPDRPGRMEPRRRKRRPKPFSLLVKPRSRYRAQGDPNCC